MQPSRPLSQAIGIVGLGALAKALDVTYQAIRKWEARGRMPRTEWTGETAYSERIEQLTAGAVTKAALLAKWPVAAEPAAEQAQQAA